jgi:hypothetical protein
MTDRKLSDKERAEINRSLRKDQSAVDRWIGRMRRWSSYPPGGGDPSAYRHGIGLIVVAIFVLVLTYLFLPHDKGRWLFVAFGFVLALAGALKIDKARKSKS